MAAVSSDVTTLASKFKCNLPKSYDFNLNTETRFLLIDEFEGLRIDDCVFCRLVFLNLSLSGAVKQ